MTFLVASLLCGEVVHGAQGDYEQRILKATKVAIGFFSTEGVVFYSITKNEVGVEASVCAGGEIGGTVMGVGASEKLQYCIDWKITAKVSSKPANRKEEIQAISKFMNSPEYKKKFLAEFKRQLKGASDEDLRVLGVRRGDIDKLESVKFGPTKDATERKQDVLEILKGCDTLRPTPNT